MDKPDRLYSGDDSMLCHERDDHIHFKTFVFLAQLRPIQTRQCKMQMYKPQECQTSILFKSLLTCELIYA